MERGLAHLARTGFFKSVHVKSLSAHAVRSLIIARKKLVGQRVTLENQIRGLAVVFGVRLPRALTAAFIDQALKVSEGIAGLSAILLASISQWMRPTSASSTAMELLSTRASRHRWLRRSRTSWRKRRAVVGSSLRPGAWRRSCSTG